MPLTRSRTEMGDHSRTPYDASFFAEHTEGSLTSARAVIHVVLEFVRPGSVVDVGCAQGEWLCAFQERGVKRVKGYDGAYVDTSRLLIAASDFCPADLSQPLVIDGTYDLAISLEVAEHLPARVAADFVRTLTQAAPVVLFSAAVPGQGGTRHINEQWSAYWKALFARHGYRRLDPIRPRIWRDRGIERWYRQNIFLYASAATLATSPELKAEADLADGMDLDLISTNHLSRLTTVRGLAIEMPRVIWRAVKRRFGW